MLSAVFSPREMLSFPSVDKATGILAQMDSSASKFKDRALCGDVLNPGGKSDTFFGSNEEHKI